MRVVAGTAGGIPLTVPRSDIRPTMDRVKAAIFSSLGEKVIGVAAAVPCERRDFCFGKNSPFGPAVVRRFAGDSLAKIWRDRSRVFRADFRFGTVEAMNATSSRERKFKPLLRTRLALFFYN